MSQYPPGQFPPDPYAPGQYPPALPPLPYMGPPVLPEDPRPTTVTVVAILGIIFGSLGVLGGLCAIPQQLGMRVTPNPMLDAVRNDPVLFTTAIAGVLINFMISALQLWGSIAAFGLRAIGRKVLIVYAIANIASSIVFLLLNVTVTHARSMQVMQSALQANPALNTPTMKSVLGITSSLGVVVGSAVVLMIWPALVLYFMNRPHVKAVFAKGPLPTSAQG